jgi:hypothetical protein
MTYEDFHAFIHESPRPEVIELQPGGGFLFDLQ